jgi:hypothetical protein
MTCLRRRILEPEIKLSKPELTSFLSHFCAGNSVKCYSLHAGIAENRMKLAKALTEKQTLSLYALSKYEDCIDMHV